MNDVTSGYFITIAALQQRTSMQDVTPANLCKDTTPANV